MCVVVPILNCRNGLQFVSSQSCNYTKYQNIQYKYPFVSNTSYQRNVIFVKEYVCTLTVQNLFQLRTIISSSSTEYVPFFSGTIFSNCSIKSFGGIWDPARVSILCWDGTMCSSCTDRLYNFCNTKYSLIRPSSAFIAFKFLRSLLP